MASIPITLIDAEMDKRLFAIDSPAARALLGQTGIACDALAYQALAYQAYEQPAPGDDRRRFSHLTPMQPHPLRHLHLHLLRHRDPARHPHLLRSASTATEMELTEEVSAVVPETLENLSN